MSRALKSHANNYTQSCKNNGRMRSWVQQTFPAELFSCGQEERLLLHLSANQILKIQVTGIEIRLCFKAHSPVVLERWRTPKVISQAVTTPR